MATAALESREELFSWEDLSLHQSCPLKLLLSHVADVSSVTELYFGCKLCAESVALYQGEETFIDHIRTCHQEFYQDAPNTNGEITPKVEVIELPAESQLTDSQLTDSQLTSSELSQLASSETEHTDLTESQLSSHGSQNVILTAAGDEEAEVIEGSIRAETSFDQEGEEQNQNPSSKIEGTQAEDESQHAYIIVEERPTRTHIEIQPDQPVRTSRRIRQARKYHDMEMLSFQNVEVKEELDEEMAALRLKTKRTRYLTAPRRIKSEPDMEINVFKCPECPKIFHKEKQLKLHLKYHMELNHVCQVCNKGFPNAYRLRDHELSHSDIRQFPCEICGKRFKKKNQLNSHMMMHDDVRNELCPKCGKGFRSKSNLRDHMRSHDGLRLYKCPECGKGYGQRGSLNRHIIAVHEKAKPHMCHLCTEAFREPNDLRIHLLEHEGRNPLRCENCGKTFAKRQYLRIHQLAEAKIKPHKCALCDRAFTSKSHYNSHIKRHANPRSQVYKKTVAERGFVIEEIQESPIDFVEVEVDEGVIQNY